MLYIHHNLVDTDPITANLMSLMLPYIIDSQTLIETCDSDTVDGGIYSSVSALQSKQKDYITLEGLCAKLHIGLATAKRTLQATTHKYIRTTGLFARRYCTDKAQLRYK